MVATRPGLRASLFFLISVVVLLLGVALNFLGIDYMRDVVVKDIIASAAKRSVLQPLQSTLQNTLQNSAYYHRAAVYLRCHSSLAPAFNQIRAASSVAVNSAATAAASNSNTAGGTPNPAGAASASTAAPFAGGTASDPSQNTGAGPPTWLQMQSASLVDRLSSVFPLNRIAKLSHTVCCSAGDELSSNGSGKDGAAANKAQNENLSSFAAQYTSANSTTLCPEDYSSNKSKLPCAANSTYHQI